LHTCIYDTSKSNNGLCDVCQVFGATGWRRRFQLSVSAQGELAWAGERPLNIRPAGRTRGWFLHPGWLGTLKLNLTGEFSSAARIRALLRLLETQGSLGARPQLGYGYFRVIESEQTMEGFYWETIGEKVIGELPDLRTFTFFKLRFRPKGISWWRSVPGLRELRSQQDSWTLLERLAQRGMMPTAPALKNHLRFETPWSSVTLPHWLFGTLRRDERMRSKVALSWAYRLENSDEWEMRGWVFLPQDATGRVARNEVVDILKRKLEQPQEWLRAIGLQAADYKSASVTFFPSSAPWQLHTSQEVVAFLNDALPEQLP
jgi:CRISPR-associated protein Cmr1